MRDSLKLRIGSGVALGAALLLAALFLPALGVWLLLLAIATVATLEFYRMLDEADIPAFRYVGLLGGIACITATYFRHAAMSPGDPGNPRVVDFEWIILFVTVIAVFIRQFPQKHNDQPLETIACTLLGFFYVPFLLNFLTRLLFVWHDGGHRAAMTRTGLSLVFYLIFVVKATDVGAYFVGCRFGRHKLIPRISPGKTWEGFFGGVATGVVVSLLYRWVLGGSLGVLRITVADAFVLGLLLAIAGVVGDLFESLLKRAAGEKDSGRMLPGMGGLLDVLDSLLFGAPVLYAYVVVFMAG